MTLVPAAQEDELRAFCRLVSRRPKGGGELAWALARFEMGCERLTPLEALTDYLLALRALLEPEGPSSGLLAKRLAVICAAPEDRARLAERTGDAVTLERALMGGISPRNDNHAVAVVEELCEHLRAVLRDALCGHLEADLCSLADDLLAEAADATAAPLKRGAGRTRPPRRWSRRGPSRRGAGQGRAGSRAGEGGRSRAGSYPRDRAESLRDARSVHQGSLAS